MFLSFSILTLAFGQWSAYHSESSPEKEAMVRIEEDDGWAQEPLGTLRWKEGEVLPLHEVVQDECHIKMTIESQISIW
jgi:hypothetical protein